MCFRPDPRPRSLPLLLLAVLGPYPVAARPAAAPALAFSIEDVRGPGFEARALRATLSAGEPRRLRLDVGSLEAAGRRWRDLSLECTELAVEPARIDCRSGLLRAGAAAWPAAFSYAARAAALELTVRPAEREAWHLALRTEGGVRRATLRVENARPAALAPWLPGGAPKPSAGTLSGTLRYEAGSLDGRFEFDGLAFSDAPGLRAGEAVQGYIAVQARERGAGWQWRAEASWRGGEVFWQPFYLKGAGQRLAAEGVWGARHIEVASARLELPGIGGVEASGVWNRATGRLDKAVLRAPALRTAPLYEQVLKPLVEGTLLSDLRVEGGIGLAVEIEDGELQAFALDFAGLLLEDRGRRFALFGVDGSLPWHRARWTEAELSLRGGEVLRLPFGAFRLPLRMQGRRVEVAAVDVPLLDGTLRLRDFASTEAGRDWQWRLRGGIAPLSMIRLTQALGLPTMHGSLAGDIPQIVYRGSTLALDGTLSIQVFDGVVEARNVRLVEPLGRAPRAYADLEMRGLDLDLLTRTFSFGTITGRVDARVAGLELVNWEPVRFDAWLRSSAGEYPRRISQAAVQNISALGGAGAAAAIQRSFLRFFEQFGYRELGISCRLENGVCEMGGVENAPQGYVLVKGGGVPSISVIGYNRNVHWQELVSRLKRITQDNVRAVVR